MNRKYKYDKFDPMMVYKNKYFFERRMKNYGKSHVWIWPETASDFKYIDWENSHFGVLMTTLNWFPNMFDD